MGQDGSALNRSWVLPYWLERQLDPTSQAHVVGDDRSNLTGRNWTLLGAVGADHVGGVDPRGLVVTRPNSWSIDWWIRSERRWHFPSREANIRQRCIDDAPVIETSMRVPGGDIEHAAYAVGGASSAVVIEIANRTPVPVAVTVAVRPYGFTSLANIKRIELDRDVVVVDGQPALIFPRRPGQIVASNLAAGDSASALVDEVETLTLDETLECPARLAQAAFSFPLVHSGVLRLILPFPVEGRRRAPIARVRAIRGPVSATEISATRVARGWSSHVENRARFVLPDGPIASTFNRAKRSLLLFQRGDHVVAEPLSDPRIKWGDAAPILGAMDRMGWHQEVGQVVASIPRHQLASGQIGGKRGDIDGTSAALAIIGDHLRLSAAHDVASSVAPTVALAAGFIARSRRDRGSGRDLGIRYAESAWALRGLIDAAETLTLAEEASASREVAAVVAEFKADLLASVDGMADRLGESALPAVPLHQLAERAIDALVAVWPAAVLRPDNSSMRQAADVVRERFLSDSAYRGTEEDSVLRTDLTARLAMVELMDGDPSALERVAWLVRLASPTGSWPRVIHPELGTGAAGEGHDGVVTAHFVTLIRSLLVHESTAQTPELALLSAMPEEWLGQAIEVHDAPTAHGRLSYAARWHGKRPALLWDLEPSPNGESLVSLTAPGLDPSWVSSEPRGEALLESR